MKFKLILLLSLILSAPTFAQLTKADIEAKFPLLSLPYEFERADIPRPGKNGPIDLDQFPFIKEDVTDLITQATLDHTTQKTSSQLSKKMYEPKSGKVRAIGRFENGKQTFLVFHFTQGGPSATLNIVYIASLGMDYKVIDVAELSNFNIFKKGTKGYKHVVIVRRAQLNKNNLLNLMETYRYEKEVNDNGEQTLNKDISRYGFQFMEDGKVMNNLY